MASAGMSGLRLLASDANVIMRGQIAKISTGRIHHSPVQLYASHVSPPARAARMILEQLEVDYEFKETMAVRGDTMTPEFLKLNPQHTIPVLVDDDLVITESKAILLHVARKYGGCGGDDSLYPEDLKLRSKVEMRLFFDQSYIWANFGRELLIPLFLHQKLFDPSMPAELQKIMKWCDDFVKPTGFIAGTPGMTIADIATLANYNSLRVCKLIDPTELPALEAWAERCQQLVKSYDLCNKEGLETMEKRFQDTVEKLRAERYNK